MFDMIICFLLGPEDYVHWINSCGQKTDGRICKYRKEGILKSYSMKNQ
jgi:hypothetical protein